MAVTEEARADRPGLVPGTSRLIELPWWALVVLLGGVLLVYFIYSAPLWRDAFEFLRAGIRITILLTLTSFSIALLLGLLTGLGQLAKNPIAQNLSALYVQVIRGVPLLVQLLFVAFVIVPAFVDLLNDLGGFMRQTAAVGPLGDLGSALATLRLRDVDMRYRAIVGLAIGYGAFEAEVFRAGIESIERGQMEAARSLGMTHFQAMRYIILPQAIRVVLPPLGNDFIAMLKDSSLVSVLAVRELTHLAQLNRARTFRSWETLGMVAFLYLVLTLSLSLLVKVMERRMAFEK